MNTIPVFISRHTANLPDNYGALIPWGIGERVRVVGKTTEASGVIQSKMLWHDNAPEIDGAPGVGRWVYEVVLDGEIAACAISAACIKFPRPS